MLEMDAKAVVERLERCSLALLQVPRLAFYSESSVTVPLQSCSGLHSLPLELLDHIFQLLCPNEVQFHRSDNGSQSRGMQERIRALKTFLDLRLLCSALNHIVTPIAYQELPIYFRQTSNLERIAGAFRAAAPHVRSVVIYGETQFPEGVDKVIGRGLGLCSQVRNLECHGRHNTFTSPRWERLAHILKSTLSSLVICSRFGDSSLSSSLIALGSRLETLEIVDWQRSTRRSDTFPLPSEMPNLKTLVINGGKPELKDLVKLVSRAIQKKVPKSERVRLQHLALVDVKMAGQDVMTVLSTNNISLHLTSLVLVFGHRSAIPRNLLVSVLNARPRLLCFISPLKKRDSKEILGHLPPALEILGVTHYPDMQAVYPEHVEAFVTSRRCSALQELHVPMCCYVHGEGLECPDGLSLKSACAQFGIELISM